MRRKLYELVTARRSNPYFRNGFTDLGAGLKHWRVSHLFGLIEIRRRYSRSRLGQFWLTMSTGVMVASMGFVWSVLWKTELRDLMPFIAISLILWTVIVGSLGEATTIFAAMGPMFLNQGMCFSTAIYGLMYKHFLILLHNLPIVVLTLIIFPVPVSAATLLALPGLLCLFVALFSLSYIVAISCLRFRDLSQVVQNVLQIAFFITPVLWKPAQLDADKSYLLRFNPLVDLFAVVREPLLGQLPTTSEWVGAVGFTLVAFLLAVPIVGAFRNRIIYWI